MNKNYLKVKLGNNEGVIKLTIISIRIDEKEKEILQQYASKNDLSVSQVVRKAIKEFFQKDK